MHLGACALEEMCLWAAVQPRGYCGVTCPGCFSLAHGLCPEAWAPKWLPDPTTPGSSLWPRSGKSVGLH